MQPEVVGVGRQQGSTTYIFFLEGALFTVVGVGHPNAPADDTPALIRAIVALITDPDQGAGPHERVADGALAIALFAQAPNGCSSSRSSSTLSTPRHGS